MHREICGIVWLSILQISVVSCMPLVLHLSLSQTENKHTNKTNKKIKPTQRWFA